MGRGEMSPVLRKALGLLCRKFLKSEWDERFCLAGPGHPVGNLRYRICVFVTMPHYVQYDGWIRREVTLALGGRRRALRAKMR